MRTRSRRGATSGLRGSENHKKREYAVFCSAYPGEPTNIHTTVSLELDAESNQFHVVLQCDSLRAWTPLTHNRIVLPEPFDPDQLEEEYSKFFDSLRVRA